MNVGEPVSTSADHHPTRTGPSFSGTAAVGMRTDYCGDLRPADVGRSVSVCGWVARRREHGEHLAFLDVRDRTGLVQCVVDGSADLRNEYVVRNHRSVRTRPEAANRTCRPASRCGGVPVEVLSKAEPPPFLLDTAATRRDAPSRHATST